MTEFTMAPRPSVGKMRGLKLTNLEWMLAKRLGDGNASRGIRRALNMAADTLKR